MKRKNVSGWYSGKFLLVVLFLVVIFSLAGCKGVTVGKAVEVDTDSDSILDTIDDCPTTNLADAQRDGDYDTGCDTYQRFLLEVGDALTPLPEGPATSSLKDKIKFLAEVGREIKQLFN